jgi:hypothetical protein
MQPIMPEPVAIEQVWPLIGRWHRQMGLASIGWVRIQDFGN